MARGDAVEIREELDGRGPATATGAVRGSHRPIPGCGRAFVWSAPQSWAAESAQADFANFQRRIHSLWQAGGT